VTLVDSSTWISFFSNKPSAPSLDVLLDAGADSTVIDVIISEVLSGFKKDQEFINAKMILLQVPQLNLVT